MQPRVALAMALVSGGLAISAVAVDLAYDLEAFLDTQEAGGWRTVATTDQDQYRDVGPFMTGCVGPQFRLRVHNDRLLPSDVDVVVSYSSGADASGPVTLLEETWHLARGETRTREFTIPDSAFDLEAGGARPYVNVNAQIDRLYLGACAEEDA